MSVRPSGSGLRATVGLAFAVGFVGMAQRSGFGVLYPNMSATEGWTAGEVTAAFSMAMLIYSPAALAAGLLVDRLGVRPTMLAGTMLFGVGLVGIALAGELWQI